MKTNTKYTKQAIKSISRSILATVISLFLVVGSSVADEDQPLFLETRQLTVDALMKIGNATLADCTQRGFKVGVSITSREGQLLYFIRHPLAGPHTPMVSRTKAYTSATMGVATSTLTDEGAQKLNHFRNVTSLGGGVPIEIAGHLYGAVGVSGATSQADEECARVGIKTVAEDLEFGE